MIYVGLHSCDYSYFNNHKENIVCKYNIAYHCYKTCDENNLLASYASEVSEKKSKSKTMVLCLFLNDNEVFLNPYLFTSIDIYNIDPSIDYVVYYVLLFIYVLQRALSTSLRRPCVSDVLELSYFPFYNTWISGSVVVVVQ